METEVLLSSPVFLYSSVASSHILCCYPPPIKLSVLPTPNHLLSSSHSLFLQPVATTILFSAFPNLPTVHPLHHNQDHTAFTCSLLTVYFTNQNVLQFTRMGTNNNFFLKLNDNLLGTSRSLAHIAHLCGFVR